MPMNWRYTLSDLIDARGENCPIPVIKAKNEVEGGRENFTIMVDNLVAVENLKRFAQSCGYISEVTQEESRFDVHFIKDLEFVNPTLKESGGTWGVFVGKENIGEGSSDLGNSLMNMFFFTLAQDSDAPDYILFMNAGVKLPVENEQVVEHLRTLLAKGSRILVCGTCLSYYNIADQLQVGIVSNMYDIVDAMKSVNKMISI